MNKMTYQFKKEVGLSLKEVATKIGRTHVWVGEFVIGQYKDQKNILYLCNYVASILGVSEDIIKKFALGKIDPDQVVVEKIDMKQYNRAKYLEYKSKGLVKKPQKPQLTIEIVESMINKAKSEILYGE